MSTTFMAGDVFKRMAELPDSSIDLILTSPPFLALRSYLPDGHPDKAKEIGSEATPAEYIDTLLALTAEWRRLLAPHGSIAIELGDTYAGSGGGGGDYLPGGLREEQPGFGGSSQRAREGNAMHWRQKNARRNGWPLAKSLTGIPTLYTWSLAYGRNLLTGSESPAGMWRIRNLKPWIRTNPPVGALADKERPATSYITVATLAKDRWFDLDAVRTTPSRPREGTVAHKVRDIDDPHVKRGSDLGTHELNNLAGTPPFDWWHQIDALIDDELRERFGKLSSPIGTAQGNNTKGTDSNSHRFAVRVNDNPTVGARGWHIRRRLETAGYLTTLDALDISPKGYNGAHYAVWPPELVRQCVNEMCPHKVCITCGEPSRRIVGEPTYTVATPGWSDCGHGTWRPGLVLDPFAGSGTTLAVCSGMGRDSIGIDLDQRNADLAQERVGMFLDIDHGTSNKAVS